MSTGRTAAVLRRSSGPWRTPRGARSSAGGKRWRSRPVSRVLSWTVIPLGPASPQGSSDLPGDTAGRGIVSLFGLAPGGVCRAGLLPGSRCALTAPFHPCLCPASAFGGAGALGRTFVRQVPRSGRAIGGLLSVALSVGSPRPGVTWHRALWSPDFPRHQKMTRLSGRLRRGEVYGKPGPRDGRVPECDRGGREAAHDAPRRVARPGRHDGPLAAPALQSPPYNALRGAPLSSAASLAACEGFRYSPSFA